MNQWIKRTILSNVGGIIQSVGGLDTANNEKKGKLEKVGKAKVKSNTTRKSLLTEPNSAYSQ